jgi:hypothetical protein
MADRWEVKINGNYVGIVDTYTEATSLLKTYDNPENVEINRSSTNAYVPWIVVIIAYLLVLGFILYFVIRNILV